VRDLALQVGHVHVVMVRHRDAADPGRAQVEGHRRTQPARTDDQGMAVEQALLALDADVVKQEVARIAQQLVVVHAAAFR
jgi:hypothetical protein